MADSHTVEGYLDVGNRLENFLKLWKTEIAKT